MIDVRFTWGHLDRMPRCQHGRIEGFCDCFGTTPASVRLQRLTDFLVEETLNASDEEILAPGEPK